MWVRILAVVLAGVVGASAPVAAQGSSSTICNVNSPAPLGLTLRDLSGRDVPLSSFRGKIVLVNFWATWCVPCKIEIPDFIDLYGRYRSKGVEIIGVDV